MKIRAKLLCATPAAFLALICVSAAGADRVITIEEALKLTAAYSRDMLIANEGKAISQGRYVEERAAAFPQLKAEAYALRSQDDSSKLFGLSAERYEYHGNLNLTQPLFTWGQIGAAIKAAKYDKDSAEYRYKEARQLALREAATSFHDLLLAVEMEKVNRDNVTQKRRHLDDAEKRHQMEVATDYDVLAARVALTNALPQLTQAENDVRLARDKLRYYMGIEGDFDVSGSLICNPKPPEPLAKVLELARAHRSEIAYHESRIGTFKELIAVAKGGDKPRLDFKGNFGWTGYDEIDSEFPGQRWDAGLYLSFPFFDGFRTRGQVIQAKSRLATSEFELQRVLDNIALEARDAINRVEEAVQIVSALAATVAQAERLLDMAQSGYRYGVKTNLDVQDAEFNLLTARSNLARARRNYLVAQTRLRWIKGVDLLDGVGLAMVR